MTCSSLPGFTVVIPCYRAAATIGTAIRSVFAQREGDFELIVVDDGCPGNSGEAAAAAIGADPRGRVIRQRNAGPAAARNRGAQAGRGAIIAFLDADDRWAADALHAHREHFDTTDRLGISFGRIRFYDQTLTAPGRISARIGGVGLADALAENQVCTTSNLVIRRSLFTQLSGFDETLTHAEDQELIVRALATTPYTVAGLDAELVHYRMSPDGLSADLGAMERGWCGMLARASTYTEPQLFAAAEPAARARFFRYLARRALRTGQPARIAAGHLATALRARPSALFANDGARTLMTIAGVAAALSLPRRLSQPLITR